MSINKDRLGLIFSTLSLILAALALIVSIRSCSQVERSTVIAEKEFASSRAATWTLEITENDSNRVKSVDNEIALQKAFLYFPPGFGVAAIPITSPDFDLSFLAERAILIATNQIDDAQARFKFINVVSSVPVGIESWYVAKGESFRDRSVYSLEFKQETSPDPEESDTYTIKISGLSFARRLKPSDSVRDILQREWEYYLSL